MTNWPEMPDPTPSPTARAVQGPVMQQLPHQLRGSEGPSEDYKAIRRLAAAEWRDIANKRLEERQRLNGRSKADH